MTEELIHLGYPEGTVRNDYYAARPMEGLGMVAAYMVGGVIMVQFFPWEDRALSAHEAYAKFITDRATQVMASRGELFAKYPFVTCETNDILMIKCLIENAIEEIKNGDYPQSAAGREAGEALE